MKEKRRKFVYKNRGNASMQKRAKQQGGMYDQPIQGKFTQFNPKAGDYSIRLLPPTWKSAEHYGYDVYVHNQVGAQKQRYLCLDKHGGEACPICEEMARADKDGEDKKYISSLRATRRVAVWIIDRNKEREGPKLWLMPWSVDRDIAAVASDAKSNEALALDDPDEGFDVDFTREGAGLNTEYIGVKVARRSSPLSENSSRQEKWLEFINNNPVPDTLNPYEYDHILKALSGKATKDDDDDDSDRKRTRKERSSRDDEADDEDDDDDRPRKRRRDIEDEDEDLDSDDEDDDSSSRNKRRKKDSDEDEDDRPRAKKKRKNRDDDEDSDGEDDEKPRAKRSRRDADEDDADNDDDRPRRRNRDDDDDDEDSKDSGRRAKRRNRDDDDEDD